MASSFAMVVVFLLVGLALAQGSSLEFRMVNTSQSSSASSILWLPLGDSITWGCGTDVAPRQFAVCSDDAGGYRVPLAWALSQQGHVISTMGTLHTGPSYVPQQWLQHEGHPGWRYDQINDILDQSLATSQMPPDLITIHLGTNDCYQIGDVNQINQNLVALLTNIHNRVPNAQVFIASIISLPEQSACANTFNQGLPGYVQSFQAQGMMLHYVPMQEWTGGMCTAGGPEDPLSGLCGSSKVHPNAAGYLRMASAFGLAIAESGVFAGAASTRLVHV